MSDSKMTAFGMYITAPSGSFTSWENTRCNPLGDMRTQMQNAWHDGYASAKVEREWFGLTDEEILEEYRQSYGDDGNLTDVYFARAIEAKLKEKNND